MNAEFDRRQVERMLAGVARQTGQTTVQLLNDVMRLWAQDLLRETWPKSGAAGRRAVQRDVNSLYLGISTLREGRLKDRVEMDEAEFDMPGLKVRPRWDAAQVFAEHTAARDSRGRVRKARDRYLVQTAHLKQLLKTKLAHVGRLKAGWMAVLRHYSLSIPAWVGRNGVKESGFEDTLVPQTMQGSLAAINRVPYADKKLGSAWVEYLMRKRMRDLTGGYYAKRWEKKMASMKAAA